MIHGVENPAEDGRGEHRLGDLPSNQIGEEEGIDPAENGVDHRQENAQHQLKQSQQQKADQNYQQHSGGMVDER